MTNILKIEYPDTLPDATHKTQAEFEQDAKMAMAAKLYELKRLSSGQAAELVGLQRAEFIFRLKDYGVPLLDLSEEELLSDIKNAG